MKTSFHFGNLNKQKYKSYYYHGLKLICKEPFNPPPYIIFPLHTPINPPNYFYECDGLPNTANPPLSLQTLTNCKLSSSSSILHFQSFYIGGHKTPNATFYWPVLPFTYLEFSISCPNVWYTGTAFTTISFFITFNKTGGPYYRSYIYLKYVAGHYEIVDSYTDFFDGGIRYYQGPYLSSFDGKVVLNPLTGKYNFFLNNILLKSNVALSPNAIRCTLGTYETGHSFIDMDYLRAWVNIPRVP